MGYATVLGGFQREMSAEDRGFAIRALVRLFEKDMSTAIIILLTFFLSWDGIMKKIEPQDDILYPTTSRDS